MIPNFTRSSFLKLLLASGAVAALCSGRANAAVHTAGTLVIHRSADGTAITSQTTLQSDAVLVIPIQASRAVKVRAFIPFALAGIISGYKFGISGPASPTNIIFTAQVQNAVTGVLALSGVATALGQVIAGALATSGDHFCMIEGTVENGVNAGNLTIQVAQNTSDASAITIKRGACFEVLPVN